MAQCTARSKRSGIQCKRLAAVGRTTCAMHGGKTPLGPASPSFKTGRYSKLLPTRLAATYEAGRQDPELLALADEIALTDARLTETLDGWTDAKPLTAEAWRDASSMIEQRRRLCESEGRRMLAMQQMITAQEAHVLIGRIIGIVTTHVTDRAILARIAADVAGLVGRADDPATDCVDGDFVAETDEVQQ